MSQEHSIEISPELAQKQTPKMETVMDWVGGSVTFVSMIPQGILGALLADEIVNTFLANLKEQHPGTFTVIRVGVDGLIFIAAEEGKRRLVRFFNEADFKQLGHKEHWKKIFDVKNYTLASFLTTLINSLWTIVPASTFAYLGRLSLEGIADLLSAYNNPILNVFSEYARKPWVQAPFMLSAFLSNMLGFPNVHTGALALLGSALRYVLENPEYRNLRENVAAEIEAVRLRLKTYYEKGNIEEAKALLNAIGITALEDIKNLSENPTKKEEFIDNILRYSREQSLCLPNSESQTEFYAKLLIGTGLSAIAITGLYNFVEMSSDAADLFGLSAISHIYSAMDYLSMSTLGFSAAYGFGQALVESLYDRNMALNIFSMPRKAWIFSSCIAICLLGGMPNAYQSLAAKENVAMAVIAVIASFLIEVYGYLALTRQNHIKTVTAKDENAALFHTVDETIRNEFIGGLPQLGSEKLHSLIPNNKNDFDRPTIPQYRSFVDTLSFWKNSQKTDEQRPLKNDIGIYYAAPSLNT